MAEPARAAPPASLTMTDVAIIVVGIVLGIGIFKTPSLVANFSSNETMFLGLWALGGLITLVGALCYAELGSARPNAGGEYSFLHEAYGSKIAVFFAWARCSVIQPGAIAAVAFVMGDYANVVLPLGPYGPGIYAIASIVIHRHQLHGRDARTLAQRLSKPLPCFRCSPSSFPRSCRGAVAAVGTPRDVSLASPPRDGVRALTYGG